MRIRGKQINLEEIVNESITQSTYRSMYTSFTTFVMVAVLYIMGVSSIREFAAPLMVGVSVELTLLYASQVLCGW